MPERSRPLLKLVEDGAGSETASAPVRGPLDRLRALIESERAQLPLWSPVALASGIGGYFALPVEPAWVVLAPAFVIGGFVGVALRRHVPRMILIALLLFAAGFGAAKWRSDRVGALVLEAERGPLGLTARLIAIERAPDKPVVLVAAPIDIQHIPPDDWPKKLRLSARTEVAGALAPGDVIATRAVLRPPPRPATPGGFDYGRKLYFEGVGATGYAVADVTEVEGAGGQAADGWRDWLAALRFNIAARIVAQLPDQSGAVAAALTVGDRSYLSEDTERAMRDAGLAHLLAISGLHLALVAGGLFFVARAVLAAIPRVALAWPVKEIAAGIGLIAAFCYLLLAGMPIPTQRAFIMASVLFVAVMLGRRAITLRSAALAAILILLWRPEALVSVGFQMSFAAVAALVAAYEAWYRARLRRAAPWAAQRSLIARLVFYFAAVAFSTIVAEAAIAPFAAYHFNRLAFYGLAANLIAIPLTTFIIMPMGVLALILMPLGLDGPALFVMGQGIDVMLAVAHEISTLPGAVLLLPSVPFASLLAVVLGVLWLIIWQRRWRWLGPAIAAGAVFPILLQDRPDIYVAETGTPVAVRDTATGELLASSRRGQRFVPSVWAEENGQARLRVWTQDPDFVAAHRHLCDDAGCALLLGRSDGQPIRLALNIKAQGLADDCRMADILITRNEAPVGCSGPAVVIDREDLARGGVHAIWISAGEGALPVFRVKTAAGERGVRPWSRRP